MGQALLEPRPNIISKRLHAINVRSQMPNFILYTLYHWTKYTGGLYMPNFTFSIMDEVRQCQALNVRSLASVCIGRRRQTKVGLLQLVQRCPLVIKDVTKVGTHFSFVI